jgi:phosphate transport system substrate-binding protein
MDSAETMNRPAAIRNRIDRPRVPAAWWLAWLAGACVLVPGTGAMAEAMAAAAPQAAAQSSARSHPLVAGSSTLFPFAVAVAERLPGPGSLVLPMGTGAGIAWFCEGLGPATPDIALASRAMTRGEADACAAAGVGPIEELQVGRDGIVVVAHPSGAVRALAIEELWLALAARVPDPAGGDRWISNPYREWRDLRADLPAMPIRVLGPPGTSGTRDALVALALRPACLAMRARYPDAGGDPLRCGELRRDGAWEDAGENDDGLVTRLEADPGALGIVGYGALARHPGRVAAVCLDGHCPSAAAIATGDYPLSRPLFLYVKTAHRALAPGAQGLAAGFFTPAAIGPEGYLLELGLVPVEGAGYAAPAPGTEESLAMPAHLVPRATLAVLTAVLLALVLAMVLMRRAVPVNRTLERAVSATLWSSAALSGALLVLVLASLVVPALGFFMQVAPLAFVTGTHWSPESAIHASQAAGEGAFGVLPVVLGSGVVALIALALALPLALAAALHGFAWCGHRFHAAWHAGIRLAALVPAVVYGLFAALTAGPAVAALAAALGAHAAVENVLAAGLVVGIMLLPALAVRIGEALEAVPLAAAESALGLGATRWETLRDIVLPGAAPGIGAAVLLAVTRALGETVIVLMALGTVAHWGVELLGGSTTLTVQMVALMSGTHELDNIRTQLPFVLGLFLAMIVLPLNAWALRMLRRSNVTPSPIY